MRNLLDIYFIYNLQNPEFQYHSPHESRQLLYLNVPHLMLGEELSVHPDKW